MDRQHQFSQFPGSLSTLAFQYRRLVFAVLITTMVYGVMSYFGLIAREDPKIIIRQAVIQTQYPGMPAKRVELLITKTLEEAIFELPEVEEVTSTSMAGSSIIHVEILDQYTNLEQIWDNLREQIDKVSGQLPEGTWTPRVNDRFGDVAVITLAMTAPGYRYDEIFNMAQHVRDLLYGVKGVEKIELNGVQQPRIYLEFSSARLALMGVSGSELEQVLQEQNIIFPGGIIETGSRRFLIAPSGNYEDLEDLQNTLVILPGGDGRPVPLRDLVDISYGFPDPPSQTAYFNGEAALVFAITMRDDINILEFSPRMKARIEELEASLPAGYQLQIATYQADQVGKSINGVTENVLQTLFIVMLVVVMFLGLRIGLIVGAIVPVVMLATLAIMNVSGIALERMSIATLIISLGLLVDNGIVVAEDFIQRTEMGDSLDKALALTGKELTIPLLTSSLTTILVFLPLMLAEHVAGEYTRSVSLVILITLASSWIMALMVTPTLCWYFHKPKLVAHDNQPDKRSLALHLFDLMNRIYRGILRRILCHRILFLIAIFLAMLATPFIASQVRSEFFPSSDRNQILVYVDLPADGSSMIADKTVRDISELLRNPRRFPDFTDIAGYVGFGGPRFVLTLTPIDPQNNKAFLVINIREEAMPRMDALVAELRDVLAEAFPDVRSRVMRMFLGPEDSSVIELQVKGADADYIYAKALELEKILNQVPHTIDVKNDWEGYITHFAVNIDQQRARRAGVTSAEIAAALERYYSGQKISEIRAGDEIFPIILRATDHDRHDPSRIGALNVYSTSREQNVPLYQIAEITQFNDFARRSRENLIRTVTVQARNLEYNAEELKPRIEPQIEAFRQSLEPGYILEYDGVIQVSLEAQAALQAYTPICLGLIFLTIIWQFNSYRRTFILLITLPLLVIGGFLGLLVFNAPFGFMVTLGFYALAGILANNAIVLIDRIDIERADGSSPNDWEAVISASVRRLRPIVMSTVTTVLGLLPLIISHDVLFYGMAASIGSGLVVGTVLTLGLVPVLYTYFFGIKKPAAS